MSLRDLELNVPKWGGRRASEALARVKAEGRRAKRPCIECGQEIDYSLPSTQADGCTVQHIRSRRDFPHLTWVPSNWAPAHLACNQSASTGENPSAPGVTSQDW